MREEGREGVRQGAWEIHVVRKRGSCHNPTHTYSMRQKNVSIQSCLTTVDSVWSRPLQDGCMTVA